MAVFKQTGDQTKMQYKPAGTLNQQPQSPISAKMRQKPVFTRRKQNVMIFYQRCILENKKNTSAGVLILLLDDYFPGLIFIPESEKTSAAGMPSVNNYVTEKNGQWYLDIKMMARSREKSFSGLFPEKINSWDEAEARRKFGRADVIRFFIDKENESFLTGFYKRIKQRSVKIAPENVPNDFFKALNYYRKFVWEDWDFSGFIMHKMRHNPPNIYEAFCFYGHKQYTLFGFGAESAVAKSAEKNYTEEELIKFGNDRLKDAIQKNIPDTKNYDIDQLTAFFELVQRTLESVPSGKPVYIPTDLDVFLKQLKAGLRTLNKKSSNANYADTYTPADRKTINNYINRIENLLDDAEILSEIQHLRSTGTYREKINFLYRLMSEPVVRNKFNDAAQDIIHGLFLKQFNPSSLDRAVSHNDETGDSFTGHEMIGDTKYLNPEERFMLTTFFKDEFRKELSRERMEQFLECLPDHFVNYPFEEDFEGNLKMTRYSKKILFTTFCSIAGITAEDELQRQFLVLLQRVIDNINKAKNPEGVSYEHKPS
jgi:hypothetical protein